VGVPLQVLRMLARRAPHKGSDTGSLKKEKSMNLDLYFKWLRACKTKAERDKILGLFCGEMNSVPVYEATTIMLDMTSRMLDVLASTSTEDHLV
jgi:hypothetical protein